MAARPLGERLSGRDVRAWRDLQHLLKWTPPRAYVKWRGVEGVLARSVRPYSTVGEIWVSDVVFDITAVRASPWRGA